MLLVGSSLAAAERSGLPAEVPVPAERPDSPGQTEAPDDDVESVGRDSACLARLRALGATADRAPSAGAEDAGQGCSISDPVTVSRVSAAIALEPPAHLDCPLAEAAVRFARDTIAPLAQERLGASLVAIRQASGYVCRRRANSTTISEHASGNALDIAGFVLADGRSIAVGYSVDAAEAMFLTAIAEAACGPFTTVLAPGADLDHADHLHLDLAERRSDAPYCR